LFGQNHALKGRAMAMVDTIDQPERLRLLYRDHMDFTDPTRSIRSEWTISREALRPIRAASREQPNPLSLSQDHYPIAVRLELGRQGSMKRRHRAEGRIPATTW
jgi:hypothetical protein